MCIVLITVSGTGINDVVKSGIVDVVGTTGTVRGACINCHWSLHPDSAENRSAGTVIVTTIPLYCRLNLS